MELIIDENSTSENQDVHLLPCKIHMDGPSKFSNYVKINKDEETKQMSASIQGRLVNGTEVKLPENFQGLFMTKNKAGSNKIFVTSTFKAFKAWNYDKIPTKNDPVQKVWDWIGISEALHADDEDSAQSASDT